MNKKGSDFTEKSLPFHVHSTDVEIFYEGK